MKYKKGDTHYVFIGPGKPYKIHILAVVDKYQIVFRWYGRRNQWWNYEIWHREMLDIRIMESKVNS